MYTTQLFNNVNKGNNRNIQGNKQRNNIYIYIYIYIYMQLKVIPLIISKMISYTVNTQHVRQQNNKKHKEK